jgi:hypothetical protein
MESHSEKEHETGGKNCWKNYQIIITKIASNKIKYKRLETGQCIKNIQRNGKKFSVLSDVAPCSHVE